MTMREIKFRLWCKDLEEIIEVNKVGFENNKLWYIECIDHDKELLYFPEKNDHVLMQYTGFEGIYEGDILYGEESDEFGSIYSRWYGLVYWDEERCGFYVKDDLDEIYRLDDYDYLRIAGNIYENPELLEVAQ